MVYFIFSLLATLARNMYRIVHCMPRLKIDAVSNFTYIIVMQ